MEQICANRHGDNGATQRPLFQDLHTICEELDPAGSAGFTEEPLGTRAEAPAA